MHRRCHVGMDGLPAFSPEREYTGGVTLGWMGSLLLTQRDSTEEGSSKKTVDIYQYAIPAYLISSGTKRSFMG